MLKYKFFVLMSILLVIMSCLNGCTSKNAYTQKHFYVMGSSVEIQIDPECKNAKTIFSNCKQLIDLLEKELSATKEGNDIWHINEYGVVSLRSIHASSLIETALNISEVCPSFDITVAAFVDIWKHAQETGIPPTHNKLTSVRNAVGYEKLKMSGRTIEKASSDVKINIDGIVYGYIADVLVEYLKDAGISYGMVYVGNCVAVFGELPPDAAFKIAITNKSKTVIGHVYLTEGALSVAHASDGAFEINGQTYCGWISPFDGYPVSETKDSIVVVSNSGAVANALSTGIFVSNVPAKEIQMHSEVDFEYITISDNNVSVSDGLTSQFEYIN